MSDDQSGAAQPQGGSVLDGLMSMGGDIAEGVVKDMSGIGDLEDGLNIGRAVVDAGDAVYDGVTGDTTAAGHDLGNMVADGFNALPYHDAAWDGMMTLGRAIDGDGNQDAMWDQGGEAAFRDAVGGTPQGDSSSLPSVDLSGGPVAQSDDSQSDDSQGGDPQGGDWSDDASADDPSMYDDQSMSQDG